MDLNAATIGERWLVGAALLQVTQPRVPCFKLGIRMGDRHFPRQFAEAGRPGTYLSIVEPSGLAAGDTIEIFHRPGHGVTVGTVERAFHADRTPVSQRVTVEELPRTVRTWATKMSRTT